MSDNVKNFLTGSDKLIATRIDAPDSSDLQQRILAVTKDMPQDVVDLEPVQVSKPIRIRRSANWPLFPTAMAASLILCLGVWMSIDHGSQPSSLANNDVVKVGVSNDNSGDKTVLSAVDLELYELLMLEDELILAQF